MFNYESQQNKGELSNKFSKAVFFGNSHEFGQELKEDQNIAEGSKRLIENAIICWNYLYLSQKYLEAESDGQREDIVRTIQDNSIIFWQHINFHGEYVARKEGLCTLYV